MRQVEDCRVIASAVITNNDCNLALILGLLCGAYLCKPDALFWDVLVRYLQKRVQSIAQI
jgi:hypothetical protein